jgi:transposase-like protein
LFNGKAQKKCSICGSLNTQKKGKQNRKQRYQCQDCFAYFSFRNEGVKLRNQFVWFKKWVMERQVYATLVRDSGMSQRSIQNLFGKYLKTAPVVEIRSKSKVHLLIDGSYFPIGLCLILYYDHDIRYVQLYRETDKERFRDIQEDLLNLKKLGVVIYSITCDGHKSILKAIKKALPEVIVQRCLVHIKRQVKNYLSESPKNSINRELLSISRKITQIKSIEQSNDWLLKFKYWYDTNYIYINEKTINEQTGREWFTHKNLHLATSLIINAIPNMFNYLDDPEIPNTTNRLESYFSHLKEKITLHRGLRFSAKKNFIKWYIHFKNHPEK